MQCVSFFSRDQNSVMISIHDLVAAKNSPFHNFPIQFVYGNKDWMSVSEGRALYDTWSQSTDFETDDVHIVYGGHSMFTSACQQIVLLIDRMMLI